MKQSDYILFSTDGGDYPNLGFCPFCGQPGWINGDDDWCEHYLGTSSSESAKGPMELSVFPKINNLPISKIWQDTLTILRKWSTNDLEKLLRKIPYQYREFVFDSVNNDWTPAAFLDFFKDYKYLSCYVDGFLVSDYCVSFFVENRLELETRFTEVINKVVDFLQLPRTK